MSLFDNFSSVRRQSSTALGPVEAFAAVAFIAVAADGYVSDSETSAAVVTLTRMQLFRSYSSDVLRRMFEKLGLIMQQQGAETLLRAAIDALPYDLYMILLSL